MYIMCVQINTKSLSQCTLCVFMLSSALSHWVGTLKKNCIVSILHEFMFCFFFIIYPFLLLIFMMMMTWYKYYHYCYHCCYWIVQWCLLYSQHTLTAQCQPVMKHRLRQNKMSNFYSVAVSGAACVAKSSVQNFCTLLCGSISLCRKELRTKLLYFALW